MICDNDFVIFFEYKLFYMCEGDVLEEFYVILFGEVNVMCDGDDVMIVMYGWMVYFVMDVVVKFVKDGI